MCFHMKTSQVELIDNSSVEQEFDDRYKGLPDTMKRVLVLYLKNALKTTTAIKQLEESAIKRKQMEWRNVTNGVELWSVYNATYGNI
ncbi:hypothetical protein Hanom_Chr16g01455021 [Helianthus anomalus]